MTILQAIILGIVQGATEFLPVSSSGHLVLTPYFLGWNIPADQVFAFDVLVQVGTLVAVILYFWSDLLAIAAAFLQGIIKRAPFSDPDARMGWLLILATIPAAVIGFTLKPIVEAAFSAIWVTGVGLLITAALLVAAEKFGKRSKPNEALTWLDAVVIGLFQSLALFPGVSRSGSTIAGGMTRDLDRSNAARFSFLMSIPIMLGSGLSEILDLGAVQNLSDFLPALIIGFLTAAVVGYIAIRWLLNYLKHGPLYGFVIYVIVLGLITLGTLLF